MQKQRGGLGILLNVNMLTQLGARPWSFGHGLGHGHGRGVIKGKKIFSWEG